MTAIVVLGFANAGPDPNAVNRWRARIAVRTARRYEAAGDTAIIVCCGGAVRGAFPEADLLENAVRRLGWTGAVRKDRDSVSTWENIANARPMIAAADRVVICSNGLHAAKGRTYLRRQDANLASKLAPALDYRVGEMLWAKPVFAAVAIWKLLRTRRST
ncbi:YdcF family protein [Curtobacterium sp. NPDC092190]|uniref:YdcF family protein n=1 Tax=Curtobacterium sp. NPDC092190 TaxID=3363973 RepID=UPI0037FF86F1